MDKRHPNDPQSNVHKYGGYNPAKYALSNVPCTVLTDESLIPRRPPCMTQHTIAMFLQPLSKELVEMPPRPTIDDIPDAVIDQLVQKDKAFWVDKPGVNAYTLNDAFYNYGMTTEIIKPPHQDVFPRSYQYDLDCIKFRRHHACDGIEGGDKKKKQIVSFCHDCRKGDETITISPCVEDTADNARERWKYYPAVTSQLSADKIRELMDELQNVCRRCHVHLEKRVGRPFKNEACNWYYRNHPPQKHNFILRKFSK